MKLKSFKYLIGLLVFCFFPVMGEDKIDIWSNSKKSNTENENKKKDETITQKSVINKSQSIKSL